MTEHASRRASLPLVIALATSGLLVTAWHGDSPARAAAKRPGAAAPAPAGVCSKNASGQVVNCPKPSGPAALPAGARSSAMVTKPITDPAAYLDTRTWTTGGGNTYPGAQWPFGMIQWSPDTSPHRADGGGYTYGDSHLVGYSLTHLSGPGCVSAGDVPILPMTGALPHRNPNSVTTAFTNRGEVAQAGYYSARSNGRNTITSQFTATAHSAIGRFTFPRTSAADFLIKLRDSERGDSASTVKVLGHRTVQGSATSGNFCNEFQGGGYGRQDYTVYFTITFNRPFTKSRVITEAGRNSVFLTFNARANRVIDAKVAISYVSTANARANILTEDRPWDFNSVRAAAQAKWNSLLTRISVSGGSAAQTQEFYSLLYKTLLQPNITSDANGQYLGSDYATHAVSGSQSSQYGMFSGWDMYHSQAQLVAMLDPAAASDMAQSLVNEYAQNGILPQWGYLNTDNYTMVGDPADAIIADIYAFGARNFDTATALTDMLAQANSLNTIRPGFTLEQSDGYLPQTNTFSPDLTYPECCRLHDQVSALLEYDNADSALSQYAGALGNSAAAAALEARANNWANELDANSASTDPVGMLLTPRCASGSFLSVTPTTAHDVYIEGDAYQYLWDVPNNYAGLFSDLGGNSAVVPALKAYLAKPNGGGVHAFMSNEFDLGEQFALDYAGDPAGTQLAVSTIRDKLYRPGPSGLRNNDDLGAESSQFIWEMLGMYPENPGIDTLVFASPGFPKAVITLPDHNTITITAPGASPTKFYASGLSIDGTAVTKLYTSLSALDAPGSTMAWTMSAAASPSWQSLAAPLSYGTAPTPPPPSAPVSSC